MLLTENDILEEITSGGIIIHDGNERIMRKPLTLKCESIDVRLGRWLYVYNSMTEENYWFDLDECDFHAQPGKHFILAHTEEFIGTAPNSGLHPTFKIKSSAARLGIVHTLAGHGEVGFHNRWAMEFTVAKPIVLKRKMAIGQVYFMATTSDGGDYSEKGTYQTTNNIDEMVKNWTKESILPPAQLKVVDIV